MEREETTGIVGLMVAIPMITVFSLGFYYIIGKISPFLSGSLVLDIAEGACIVLLVICGLFIYSYLKFLYPGSWSEKLLFKILRSLE